MSAPRTEVAAAFRFGPVFGAVSATLLVLAFLPLPFWVARVWTDGVLSSVASGLLALPVCFFLVALAGRFPAADHPERRGAAPVLAAAVALHLLALVLARSEADALMLSGVAAPFALWAWVWGRHGYPTAARHTFPILFGLFALPWERFIRSLDQVLQGLSADVAHAVLNLAGYTVHYWDAFTLWGERFYVVVNETCSGINMLITLAMYTLVFGWVTLRRPVDRMALVVLVGPLALLANGLRVAIIYVLGHYGGEALALGFWHDASAYLVFLPVFWFLYVVSSALTRRARQKARASVATTTPSHQSPKRV